MSNKSNIYEQYYYDLETLKEYFDKEWWTVDEDGQSRTHQYIFVGDFRITTVSKGVTDLEQRYTFGRDKKIIELDVSRERINEIIDRKLTYYKLKGVIK